MNKIFIVLALLLMIWNASAQNLSWVKPVSGNNTQEVIASIVDQNGNVYSTGEYKGIADFDPGVDVFNLSSQGNTDIFIQKYDVNGGLIWAHSFGDIGQDNIRDIALDDNGNVYVTGAFRGTIDFDPGVGIYNLTYGGYADIFVLKLNANGEFIWARNFESFIDFSMGNGIQVDQNGNVYTTGKLKGNVDFDPGVGTNIVTGLGSDIFIHKMDSNGDFLWVKTFGGSGQAVEEGQALEIDEQGSLYISGIFMSTVDFDPGLGVNNLTAAGTYPNIFVLKMNQNAEFIWAKGFGSTNNIHPSAGGLAVKNSDLFVIGGYNGTVDFDPGTGVFTQVSAGSGDIYIEKLDTAGNFVWVKTFGNFGIDKGFDVSTDYFGNVYATGHFAGTVDFDPDIANTYDMSSVGNLDAFVLKLNDLGEFEWCYQLGDGNPDRGASIVSDEYGASIIVSGFFANTVDFDPAGGNVQLTSMGLSDGFVQKIEQVIPCLPDSNQIAESICHGESYTSPSGNHIWNQAGVYIDTLTTVQGCDSLITIDLAIIDLDDTVIQQGAELTAVFAGGTYQWINCDNNTPIQGATTSSYTAIVNGNYAVEINGQGCVTVSDCYAVTTLNIGQTDLNAVKVYPNPSIGGILSLNTPLNRFTRIEIINTNGQTVKYYDHLNVTKVLDVSDLSNGIYLLHGWSNDGELMIRFVKH